MNFAPTAEQQMLIDSVARFVNDEYALEDRQRNASMRGGYNLQVWSKMAELGWLGLTMPEEHGGFGGDRTDMMLLMEQFGRGLIVEPYLATIVLGARALELGAAADVKADLLPRIRDGAYRLTLAHAEAQAGFDLYDVTCRAESVADGYVLSGTKSMVPNAGTMDAFVVVARTAGERRDRAGISMFLVPADTDGVAVKAFPTVDGLQAGEVSLTDVAVPATNTIGAPGDALGLLETLAAEAILALSAEAVGAMEMLYKDTVAYTKERIQFDHPLAEFQVLQHRMVDMFIEYEQCRSLLYRATLEVNAAASDAARSISALKYYVGRAGYMIGENAVQLHGGMGMTEELRVGHYFKRLIAIDTAFGTADHHLQLFAT